jgi:hypothetical protein
MVLEVEGLRVELALLPTDTPALSDRIAMPQAG